ncbi:MAG: hypothetical protein ACSHYF_10235 [Verrucomicrobiaceae bacterium]
MAILLGILIPVAIPAKDWVWRLRYKTAMEQATEKVSAGQIPGARERLDLAWQVSDRSLRELREMLVLSRMTGSGRFSDIARRMVSGGEGTKEDYRSILEGCLIFNEHDLFEEVESAIPVLLQGEMEIRALRSRFLFLTGRKEQALVAARECLAEAPTPETRSLVRQMLLVGGGNAEAFREAAELIKVDLASEDREVALTAYREIRGFPGAERWFDGDELLLRLKEGQLGGEEEILFAHSLRVRGASEAERGRILAEVRSEFGSASPDAFSRWLLENGLGGEIHPAGPETGEEESETVYLARIQVLIDGGKFEEAREQLENPHFKVATHLIEALRSGVAFGLGEPTTNLHFRNRAIKAAAYEDSFEAFRSILVVANRFGDRESERKIIESLIQLNPLKLPPASQLGFIDGYLKDDLKSLCGFYERCHAAIPEDVFIRRKYALLLTVTGRDAQRARRLLRPVFNASPTDSLACALGLTYLPEDPEGAKEEVAQVDPRNLKPPAKAILATILHLNGEREEALLLLDTVRMEEVSPLLGSYLGGLWAELKSRGLKD